MAKVLEINSETSVCECCGKSNLKRVVVIEKDNGEIVRYGTDCAAKAMLVKKSDTAALVDLQLYVKKWASKYSLEVVANGIWNKRGFNARVNEGAIEVRLASGWVVVS